MACLPATRNRRPRMSRKRAKRLLFTRRKCHQSTCDRLAFLRLLFCLRPEKLKWIGGPTKPTGAWVHPISASLKWRGAKTRGIGEQMRRAGRRSMIGYSRSTTPNSFIPLVLKFRLIGEQGSHEINVHPSRRTYGSYIIGGTERIWTASATAARGLGFPLRGNSEVSLPLGAGRGPVRKDRHPVSTVHRAVCRGG